MKEARVGTKLVRSTSLVLALVMAVGISWNVYSARKQAQVELLEQSRVLAAQVLALRQVAADNQHKINYDSKGNFEFKHLNPAALTQNVNNVFNATTAYSIRQVSLSPRVPQDKPDDFEMAKLLGFKQNTENQEAWGYDVLRGERYFRYMIPLHIAAPCLACHGEPRGEIDISGNRKEGYDIGDLAGALVISIPTKLKEQSLTRSITQTIILTVIAIAFSGIIIIFHTNRFITAPIAGLSRFSQALGQGHLSEKPGSFKAYGEIRELTERFSDMAAQLKDMYDQLEQKVSERTKELAMANSELARVSQYKSDFLANMSHELRTPLTAILAFTEELLNHNMGRLTPEQEDYLNEIQDSGKQLLGLINDLLDLSKIESGKMTLSLKEIDICRIVCQMEKFLRPLAQRKEVEIRVCAVKTKSVIADPEKVGHVVRNLLSNAIKFSPEGGLVEITVSNVGEPVDGIKITVKDNGPGISEAHKNMIFDAFYQVNKGLNREFQGTGLGLALVKKIVDLHLGQIEINSTPGEGAVFSVFLPAYPAFDENLE